ncbi:MAG TPA: CPBP family glutamic-type intramembrane protease [Cyclobacteriaceae bacterium]|nr:CPBP family glutamic-type intramembrane protease [Cyclobacteriaceae bacterium]
MKEFYQRYKPIIVFYFLACLFSWPFLFWRDVYGDSWNSLNIDSIIKTSLIMWGPGLSAVISSLIFKDRIKKTITLFGSSVFKSILFWGLPMAAFVLFGEYSNNGTSVSRLVIYLGGVFLFTLGEELGWRGFLQDQLNHLPKWKRYLIIGIMWELWHFTTRTLSGSVVARVLRPLLFIMPNTMLSYVFGESVNKSKSIIVAVTLHAWYNLLFEFNNINTYIIFSIAVIFWIVMLLNWDKKIKLEKVTNR